MTKLLYGIEMLKDGEWVFLPNLIMVGKIHAEWEAGELAESGCECRLVVFERQSEEYSGMWRVCQCLCHDLGQPCDPNCFHCIRKRNTN